MRFQTRINESIFASEIVPERSYMFDMDLKTGLSIIWNTEGDAEFMIDNELITINKNCIIFLTEFYKIDNFRFEKMNVIQFNRQFYCVQDNDELGCRGLLFFGESHIPKITIPENRITEFQSLWNDLMNEMDEHDDYKLEMLKSLLQRFLILCVRKYKKENHNLPTDNVSVGLIRQYNYLVEMNYKKYSKVSDYAKLLYKSPKTLSNIFKKYIDKTPLQIINNRRLLEAKRLLKYTDSSIQNISEELNFNDIQSFSHFFTSKVGEPPSDFRKKLN